MVCHIFVSTQENKIYHSISQVMKDICRRFGKYSTLYTNTQNPLLFSIFESTQYIYLNDFARINTFFKGKKKKRATELWIPIYLQNISIDYILRLPENHSEAITNPDSLVFMKLAYRTACMPQVYLQTGDLRDKSVLLDDVSNACLLARGSSALFSESLLPVAVIIVLSNPK